jgi:hypothetical protein
MHMRSARGAGLRCQSRAASVQEQRDRLDYRCSDGSSRYQREGRDSIAMRLTVHPRRVTPDERGRAPEPAKPPSWTIQGE